VRLTAHRDGRLGVERLAGELANRAGIENATFTLVEIIDEESRIVAHGVDSPRGLIAGESL
jgi:hypothetical protein